MTTHTDFGHRLLVLSSTTVGRLRASRAQVLVAVLAGEVEALLDDQPARLLSWGDVQVVAPGRVWGLRAANGPARLLVISVPAGVEKVVAALCQDPPAEPHRRLALALDEGVELLL